MTLDLGGSSASLHQGTTAVPLTNGRQGLLRVPSGEISGLVVALHGAGGQPAAAIRLFERPADRFGLVLLAPASAGGTWAMLMGGADVDTAAMDAALGAIFESHPLERRFRDMHTVTQQLQGQLRHFETVGAWMLGAEADLTFV